MYGLRVHTVKMTFVTKDGVRVERTVQLRDTSRARAEYRAKMAALPPGATNVAVVR